MKKFNDFLENKYFDLGEIQTETSELAFLMFRKNFNETFSLIMNWNEEQQYGTLVFLANETDKTKYKKTWDFHSMNKLLRKYKSFCNAWGG